MFSSLFQLVCNIANQLQPTATLQLSPSPCQHLVAKQLTQLLTCIYIYIHIAELTAKFTTLSAISRSSTATACDIVQQFLTWQWQCADCQFCTLGRSTLVSTAEPYSHKVPKRIRTVSHKTQVIYVLYTRSATLLYRLHELSQIAWSQFVLH